VLENTASDQNVQSEGDKTIVQPARDAATNRLAIDVSTVDTLIERRLQQAIAAGDWSEVQRLARAIEALRAPSDTVGGKMADVIDFERVRKRR